MSKPQLFECPHCGNPIRFWAPKEGTLAKKILQEITSVQDGMTLEMLYDKFPNSSKETIRQNIYNLHSAGYISSPERGKWQCSI